MAESQAPERISNSLPMASFYPVVSRASLYPFAQPKDLLRPISSLERVRYEQLRRFTRTPPAFSAIKQITDGILRMPWLINPPMELKKNEAAIQVAKNATKALQKPNMDATLSTNREFQAAIADDLLTINYACVERQGTGDPERPFWLWAANSAMIRFNKDWTPQREGIVPKFLDYGKGREPVPIMAENMFMLINNVNSYEAVPPSPLEIAFNVLNAWLGLSDYQQQTTSNAVQEYMLFLGDVTPSQMDSFREYWQVEVVQNKKKMIFAGPGQPAVLKAGAASDAGLYQLYCQYLLQIIAMCFSMTTRDMNIVEHDNRATAGASADKTFQGAIVPVAQTMDEGFAEEVIDYYIPDFQYKRIYKEPRSEAELRAESREDYKSGILTLNEVRSTRDVDPVEIDRFINRSIDGEPDPSMQPQQQQKQDAASNGDKSADNQEQSGQDNSEETDTETD